MANNVTETDEFYAKMCACHVKSTSVYSMMRGSVPIETNTIEGTMTEEQRADNGLPSFEEVLDANIHQPKINTEIEKPEQKPDTTPYYLKYQNNNPIVSGNTTLGEFLYR